MVQRWTAQRKEEFVDASLVEERSGSRHTTALISLCFIMLVDNGRP